MSIRLETDDLGVRWTDVASLKKTKSAPARAISTTGGLVVSQSAGSRGLGPSFLRRQSKSIHDRAREQRRSLRTRQNDPNPTN
jgi:hypothetical protein